MPRILGGLIAGLLFGAGLSMSGMMNPAKVIGFLDITGNWDPSLAFVMLGGLIVTALGYKFVLRRDRPLFETGFAVPARRDIDPSLLLGAGLFGLGWGLAGYCPGPALAGIGFGNIETLTFVAAMLAGMIAARRSAGFLSRRT
ncbi:MAG: DUF6691 family protein [Rhodospirillaceae bacterium]